MATLCLAGPAAEAYFCGSIENGADCIDTGMARQYLAGHFELRRIAAEIARLRDAADRLVRTPWAQQRIEMIAAALLERGTLSGADIDAIPPVERSECGILPRCKVGNPTDTNE